MSWIPGWESITSTGWWSGFFFWASIFSLIGLGISEIASHRYSERKDELVAEQQRIEKQIHDKDMARVQHDTAQANERAAGLEREAEIARAAIADANARALEAKLALETFKAPRSLTAEQQARVTSKMKQFAGQEYAFAISPTLDAMPLMEQIDKALNDAGWVKVAPLGALTVAGAAVAYFKAPGVRVQVSLKNPDAHGSVATSLAGALTAEGVMAESAKSPDVDVRPTTIQIVIGIKPQ